MSPGLQVDAAVLMMNPTCRVLGMLCFLHQQSGIQNAGTKHAIVLCVTGCTSICSSSSVPALLALTRRADSRFATRLLILRLSASVKAVESGSPLYAIGRPAFFFFGSYRANHCHPHWVAVLQPSNEMCCRSAQVKGHSHTVRDSGKSELEMVLLL